MTDLMKKAGLTVRGVDIDPAAQKRARENGIIVVDTIAEACTCAGSPASQQPYARSRRPTRCFLACVDADRPCLSDAHGGVATATFDGVRNSGDGKEGPRSEGPMPYDLHHLRVEPDLLRHLMREAALRILSSTGFDLPPGPLFKVRQAVRWGFLITHRIAEPGAMRRRAGVWNTRAVLDRDAPQETVEIQAGESLIVLGWRGRGPIAHDRLRRGPWEFDLLRIALMMSSTRETARLPQVMPLGASGERWPAKAVVGVRDGRLRGDVAYEVHGTRGRIRDVAPAGSTFADLVGRIERADEVNRWPGRHAWPDAYVRTGFTLRASTYGRPRPAEGLPVRRHLTYWVAPWTPGLAAKLIVRLDREAASGRRRAA